MSKKEAIQAADYDEEMTVTMELEDGESVTCAIITILTVNEKDYIILLPLDEKGENEDGEVWIYTIRRMNPIRMQNRSCSLSKMRMNMMLYLMRLTNISIRSNLTN